MAFKDGYKPSNPDATSGFCAQCTADYADGKHDCEHTRCEFYSRHKYRKLTPNFDWIFDEWGQHIIRQRAMGLTKEEYVKQLLDKQGRAKFSLIRKVACSRCNAHYYGGAAREDCRIYNCPIYYWMPYRENYPDLSWLFEYSVLRKHYRNAIINGYVIKGKRQTIIDQSRYLRDHIKWIGQRPQIVRAKRIRKIA
jgi:hypothetical protein